jgi:hypothetical protein
MRCRPLVCLLLLAVAAPAFAADDRNPLTRARQLYNMRDYARAVQAADEAHRVPEHADSADLIAARA